MHVVLSGYYGFDNVGDEAILFSIIQALREKRDGIEITVLSNNPTKTRETYGVYAVNRWSLKEINATLAHADGLISGGGSLLQDATSMKSIPYYTGIMQIAKKNKTPIFIYAQGMGPINKALSIWLTKMTLNKVAAVTVRDQNSKLLLEEIGVRGNVDVVPDPVLGLDANGFESKWLAEQKLGDFVAVSVRDWPSDVGYYAKIADALDRVVAGGRQIVFVPMHGKHDDEASTAVAELMTSESLISPYDDSIQEKIAVIGASQLLVGMRLHALIFAAVGGRPFVALSYDPKIDAFAEMVDLPVAGHVERDDWDGEELHQQVSGVLNNLDGYGAVLSEKVERLHGEAVGTARRALEVFAERG